MSEFCSLCQLIEPGPYCPNHGVVHRRFSIGGHDVDELIGAGALTFGFGGRERASARPVVIKVLRPHVVRGGALQQRFLDEAAACRAVTHDSVAALIDAGWDDELGVTYVAMERLSGQTAEALVRASGPLAWPAAVRLLAQLCRGVAAFHAAGISDGHLTARKLFVVDGPDGLVGKLCDFGLSSGSAASGAAEPRDDVYGIGTVGHELLTGRLPLEGGSAAGMLSDDPIRINERFPALVVPGALDGLVRACRVRDPLSRPSLDEIDATLRALEGAGGHAVAAAAPTRPPAAELGETGPVALEAVALASDSWELPASGPAASDPARAVAAPAASSSRAPGAPVSSSLAPAVSSSPAPEPPGSTPVAEAAPAPGDSLALPQEMIGSYRVIALLGTGGTGQVYLGQHPVIGSKVAIKVLFPEIASSAETVERFIQEARASSQIASPHIPRYFDFGTTPRGLPYATMEYFDGETLGDRIARSGTLSVGETAQILEQVASALLMAHEAGLIHRDLKPDNIFLVKSDAKAGRTTPRRAASIGPAGPVEAFQVKVLDFGIAKMVGTPSANRTLSGYFLGTPFYCAPEQTFGGEVDARSDVYSLGATAFEMLTGTPPFVGEVPEVLAAKATRDAPGMADLRAVPSAVADTIATMLVRERTERAPSMAWVLEQLASWADEPEAAPAAHRAPTAQTERGAPTAPRTELAPVVTAVPARPSTVTAGPQPAAPVSLGVRDEDSAGQSMPALERARGRRTAALVSGAVLMLAAGIVVLGRISSRSEPSRPAAAAARPAPAPAMAPRPAVPEPVVPPAAAPQPSAPEPVATQPSATAPSAPPPATGAAPPPLNIEAAAGGPERKGSGSAAPHAHPGKPSDRPDKRPAGRKPPASKDVLIVDPFAQGK